MIIHVKTVSNSVRQVTEQVYHTILSVNDNTCQTVLNSVKQFTEQVYHTILFYK